MTARDILHPRQFGLLRAGDTGFGDDERAPDDVGIREIADVLYQNEPHYMADLEADIRQHGMHNPVRMETNSRGQRIIYEGHHRAAAAYRAGADIPVVEASTDETEDTAHSQSWRKLRRDKYPDEYEARMRFGEAYR